MKCLPMAYETCGIQGNYLELGGSGARLQGRRAGAVGGQDGLAPSRPDGPLAMLLGQLVT